ncbi:MAG: tRNA glutamyl-Q(34) synthetase GluQRS [Sulfitobacter sp.]
MTFTTRFAPSPTGPLHLGHAYSAILAHDMARANKGVFLLRIEDIDQSRARRAWETQIFDDLAWLGLTWPTPVVRQSDHLNRYQQALDLLWESDLLYPCTCTRRDIANAASAPQEGVAIGPDGIIYPKTCAPAAHDPKPSQRPRPQDAALRFSSAELHRLAPQEPAPFHFEETGSGPDGQSGIISFSINDFQTQIGDVVLGRRDMGTSYHLSVVLDDAAQNISHVVRGRDLFEATKIHVVLQRALDLPTPIYHHHRLIRDESGARLAKRDDARALSKYRAEGATPGDIRRLVGL